MSDSIIIIINNANNNNNNLKIYKEQIQQEISVSGDKPSHSPKNCNASGTSLNRIFITSRYCTIAGLEHVLH